MKLLIITDSNTTSLSESFYTLLIRLKNTFDVLILDKAELKNENLFNLDYQDEYFCYELKPNSESYEFYIKNREKTTAFGESEFSAIWIRLDPPVANTLLRHIDKLIQEPLMINSPEGIIKSSTKEFLLNYPTLSPEMSLCSSISDIEIFCQNHSAVIKPLNGFGGAGIYRIDGNIGYIEQSKTSSIEVKKKIEKLIGENNKFLAVKFLANVKLGDKRVLVVNEKIIGVLNRVPCNGSWLANLAQGATSVSAKITDRDKSVAKILSNDLKTLGITVFGFDVLIDDDGNEVLSEINTINVGGFSQIQEFGYPEAINESAALITQLVSSYELKLKCV